MNLHTNGLHPFGNPHHPSPSHLVFLEQSCLTKETYSRNGVQKEVHVVVKNAPFNVRIGVAPAARNFNLKNATFDVSLYYDSEGEFGEKKVDYLRTKPVTFKSSVVADGSELTLELRIKVLTSQHENSFFRVYITALNPSTGVPLHPSLALQTAPYKVISKPENRKRKAPTGGYATKKTKTVNDLLIESMIRLEQQQKEHQALLQKLLADPPVSVNATSTSTPPSSSSTPETKPSNEEPCDFQGYFKKCFDAFRTLPAAEKSAQIKKLVRNLGQKDLSSLAEFIDMFLAEEGLDKDLPQRNGFDMKLPMPNPAPTNAFSSMDQMLSHDSYKDFLRSSLTDLTNSLPHVPNNELPELCC